jgi:hypothetical protein
MFPFALVRVRPIKPVSHSPSSMHRRTYHAFAYYEQILTFAVSHGAAPVALRHATCCSRNPPTLNISHSLS